MKLYSTKNKFGDIDYWIAKNDKDFNELSDMETYKYYSIVKHKDNNFVVILEDGKPALRYAHQVISNNKIGHVCCIKGGN
jgi:hypothetical protein